MNFICTKATLAAAVIALLLLPGSPAYCQGAEVYTWTDENGVVHYSSFPRSDGESRSMTLPQAPPPGSSDAYPAQAQPAPAADAEEVAADGSNVAVEKTEPELSVADQRRKEMRERSAEAREKQAERDLICARAQQQLAQVEPSRRVFYTDEQGETVRMDDNERMRLIEENKRLIDENCN